MRRYRKIKPCHAAIDSLIGYSDCRSATYENHCADPKSESLELLEVSVPQLEAISKGRVGDCRAASNQELRDAESTRRNKAEMALA